MDQDKIEAQFTNGVLQVTLPTREEAKRQQMMDMGQETPDFFQMQDEESLRQQVRWLRDNAGCELNFFAGVLQMEERRFSAWLDGGVSLSSDEQAVLLALWGAVLHLLSFVNFDAKRLTQMLDYVQEGSFEPSPLTPPWSGRSIRSHLENEGPRAIADVGRWVEAFRFGDYAARQPEDPCLSSQP